MKIGIVVFAYNRSSHLSEVLAGLKKNQGIDKLYIFQDGLKCEKHRLEWEKVKTVIEAVDWCEKDYRLSSYNKGLARSVVDGINAVFEENDAVIVLEDDCVPTANFISFMRQCFEKYRENKNVYCVSGYSFPIEVEQSGWDVYACGSINSWGWGTWKDRWSIYAKDYEIIKRMKQDADMSRQLAAWGSDLEDMLVGNIRGTVDSWAVFWALEIIARNGICIIPYDSLIRNIGMDGTGVHCIATDRFEVQMIDEEKEEFILPDDIAVLEETKRAFAALDGSYAAVSYDDETKEDVLVYGVGNFYKQNEKKITEKYNIKAYIDNRKRGWYAGREIVRPDEIKNIDYDYILIMIQDVQECMKVVEELKDYRINCAQILVGHDLDNDGKINS